MEPYIDRNDNLVIPFNCPEKYQYWKHPMSRDVEVLTLVLLKLGRIDMLDRYVFTPSERS